MLFGKRSKSKSIDHPLGKNATLERIKKEDYPTLITALMNKDMSVMDIIIKTHLRLAIKIAGQYAEIHPNKDDDLVSSAIEGLVLGCHEISEGRLEDDNLVDYLISRMHSRCLTFLKQDVNIRSHKKLTRLSIKDFIWYDNKAAVLYQEILSLATTRRERDVIKFRVKGFSDEEIGEKLGITQQFVHKIRKQIKKRFELETC